MLERPEWRRAKGYEDELNKPMASVRILSLLIVVVVVVLLFYVHGKHLRSCRDGQLT